MKYRLTEMLKLQVNSLNDFFVFQFSFYFFTDIELENDLIDIEI